MKTSSPVTNVWPNYTPKQETESQVVVSSHEFTEPQNKSHDSSQHYVTRSGRISEPPETKY